jgi:predicted aspartyl protease
LDAVFFHGDRRLTVPAFVDTGADTTQIPRAMAEQLGLQMITDDAILRGATGDEADVGIFVANLQLGDLHFPYIEVVGAPDADDVLIGREILARLVSTFDGPRQQFALDDPVR